MKNLTLCIVLVVSSSIASMADTYPKNPKIDVLNYVAEALINMITLF